MNYETQSALQQKADRYMVDDLLRQYHNLSQQNNDIADAIRVANERIESLTQLLKRNIEALAEVDPDEKEDIIQTLLNSI